MRALVGCLYVALIIGPGYLAGAAAGEDITLARVGAYVAAVLASVAVGYAVRRPWMYALPWMVWGGWVEIETVLRVATDSRIFVPGDAPIGIGMLAAAESLGLWAGAWLGERTDN